jgi:methylated-DNA-protein-cysteine methyltransferase-like protein
MMKDEIIAVIRTIPRGKVASYGQIAQMAGMQNGARRVARLLHSSSDEYSLPWHRVVRSDGCIAFSSIDAKVQQKLLLKQEGVIFKSEYCVDMVLCGICSD